MDIERVVVRVAQLLRLARDQPNKPEGALAGQIARQLQEKYGVDVQLTDAVSERTAEFFRVPKRTKTTLSSTLLHMLACTAFEISADMKEDGTAMWLMTAPDPLLPNARRLGQRLDAVLKRESKKALKGFDEPDQAWVLATAASVIEARVSMRLEDLIKRERGIDDDDDEELDETTVAIARYKTKVVVDHHESTQNSATPERELTEIPRRVGQKLGEELLTTFWYEVRQARREAGF